MPHVEPEETSPWGAPSPSQQVGSHENPSPGCGCSRSPQSCQPGGRRLLEVPPARDTRGTQGYHPVLTERRLCAFLILLRGTEGRIPCRERTHPSLGISHRCCEGAGDCWPPRGDHKDLPVAKRTQAGDGQHPPHLRPSRGPFLANQGVGYWKYHPGLLSGAKYGEIRPRCLCHVLPLFQGLLQRLLASFFP